MTLRWIGVMVLAGAGFGGVAALPPPKAAAAASAPAAKAAASAPAAKAAASAPVAKAESHWLKARLRAVTDAKTGAMAPVSGTKLYFTVEKETRTTDAKGEAAVSLSAGPHQLSTMGATHCTYDFTMPPKGDFQLDLLMVKDGASCKLVPAGNQGNEPAAFRDKG